MGETQRLGHTRWECKYHVVWNSGDTIQNIPVESGPECGRRVCEETVAGAAAHLQSADSPWAKSTLRADWRISSHTLMSERFIVVLKGKLCRKPPRWKARSQLEWELLEESR